jgi:enterochelin esterase-like enzyme
MPIAVFLPPGYDSGSADYPVLYMLHGLGWTGTELNWEWEYYGTFDVAEALMERGDVQPFIIVLPQGEQSY